MILRNHGALVCGETVEAAFRRAHILERACQFQVMNLCITKFNGQPWPHSGEGLSVPGNESMYH